MYYREFIIACWYGIDLAGHCFFNETLMRRLAVIRMMSTLNLYDSQDLVAWDPHLKLNPVMHGSVRSQIRAWIHILASDPSEL